MNAEQQIDQWGQIVAKAWQDDAFKKRLVSNPSAALKEEGLEVPSGVQIRIVENTDTLVYLTLPARPLDGEISDDELAAVAGGMKVGGGGGTISRALAFAALQLMIDQLPKQTSPPPK